VLKLSKNEGFEYMKGKEFDMGFEKYMLLKLIPML